MILVDFFGLGVKVVSCALILKDDNNVDYLIWSFHGVVNVYPNLILE